MAFAGPSGNYGAPSYTNPQLYRTGFKFTNDGTSPNTIVDVGIGQCRDSTDTFQIISNTALTVSSAFVGIGGLDVGTVTASTLYAVYGIADPISNNPTGLLLSKNLANIPTLPQGYTIFRLLDYVYVDSSSHFASMIWSGAYNDRTTTYVAPLAATYTPATAATQVDLSKWVPPIAGVMVTVNCLIAPLGAGNKVTVGSTSAAISSTFSPYVSGSVSAVPNAGLIRIPVSLVSGVPSIFAKNTSASDSVSICVISFEYYGG